ncbi:MAG: M23 family metallopeptidase [Candidatus Saccharimonadaceae bacterium]
MKINRNKLSIIALFLFIVQGVAFAQYGQPLNIPSQLSANFGELRNNHFHSGLDFKTQQVVNKPVFAVADGFISRISVSPGGYGFALYIDHPTQKQTSVYGHLNSFSKQIADYVEQKQYKQESFRVDLQLEAGEIPVTKGEQIALSGNRGSSGGPHLHFEIRDSQTQNPIDPLQYVAKDIRDTQQPDIRGVAFYPIDGKGSVNASQNPARLSVSKSKSGNALPLSKTITAWGKIGLGVKAYDRMNGLANIYGVKHVRLFVDNAQVFNSTINEYSFSDTRMLNSFIDFEDWRNNKSFYMKSFIDPGNTLHFYNSVNNGYINIDEERAYRMKYELEDHSGNIFTYELTVQGKFQQIPTQPKCKNYMAWQFNNNYVDYDFTLNIPAGNLYSDFCYTHSNNRVVSNNYYSDIHQVNSSPIPLHKNGTIWIKLKSDTMTQRNKYGIVKINKTNNRDSWMGGIYKNGGVELNINELGDRYAITIDTVAPKIIPIEPQTWKKNGRIRVKLSDDKSGLNYFRGTIDGQFVLFEHDSKSNVYTYTFNRKRLGELPIKRFQFEAKDSVGNEKLFEYEL